MARFEGAEGDVDGALDGEHDDAQGGVVFQLQRRVELREEMGRCGEQSEGGGEESPVVDEGGGGVGFCLGGEGDGEGGDEDEGVQQHGGECEEFGGAGVGKRGEGATALRGQGEGGFGEGAAFGVAGRGGGGGRWWWGTGIEDEVDGEAG